MLENKQVASLDLKDQLKPVRPGLPMVVATLMVLVLLCIVASAIYSPIFRWNQEAISVEANEYKSYQNVVTLRIVANKKIIPNIETVSVTNKEKTEIRIKENAVFDTKSKLSDIVDSSEKRNPEVLTEQAESSSQQYALVEYSKGDRIPPVYPQRARLQNIEGYVLVEFTINVDGSVSDIVIIESEPKHIFENAVLNAVRSFKYSPKIVNGKAVTIKGVKNRFEFKLDS